MTCLLLFLHGFNYVMLMNNAESQSQLEPQGSDVLNLSKGVHFLRENAYFEHNFGENVEVLDLVNV
jgi:hypothetical protein